MADPAIQIVVRYEDDALWATVEEYPGVFATGDNLEELRESLEEGISLYLSEPGEQPQQITLGPLQLQEREAPASADLVLA